MGALNQTILLQHIEQRLAASGTTLAEFLGDGANEPRPAPAQRLAAIVVLKGFEIGSFVRGTLSFVAQLAPPLKTDWYREFTRTLFLVGDPARLAARFAFDHVAADGSCAWVAPAPVERHATLKRLLKPLRTERELTAPDEPTVCALAGAGGRTLRLALSTRGLRREQYLIHLNHVLCEAAIEERLRPEDRLELTHVPEIDRLPPAPICLRVHRDTTEVGQLRLYAVMEEMTHAS